MSLSRRVGRNAMGHLAGRLYTSTLAFVITALVLPRRLDVEAFGVFAFYLTLHLLLSNVLDVGAGTIVIREASRKRELAGRLIGLLVRIKATVAAVGIVALIAVAWSFEGPGTRFALLVMACLPVLFHAPAGAGAIFHVDMTFRWAALASAAGQTAWLAGTVVLALLGVDDPAPYVLAFGLGTVVNGVASYRWASRRVAITYDADREELRRLWSAAWPAGVSMIMASVYFYIDTAMLRPLRGDAETAHYSAAYRLMTFVLMLPVLFSQVIFPVFSRLWERGPDVLRPFFDRSVRLLVSLGIVVPATVPLISGEVMGLVYPADYAPGVRALAILSLAVVAVFAAYPHVLLLLASGHQRVMMVISIAAAALNVGSNLAVIPRWGIEGAAWTTVGTELFVVLAAAVCGRHLTGVSLAPALLVRPVVCAAGAAAALAGLLPWLPAHDLTRVVVGVVVALAAVLAAGVLPLDLGTEEGAPDV